MSNDIHKERLSFQEEATQLATDDDTLRREATKHRRPQPKTTKGKESVRRRRTGGPCSAVRQPRKFHSGRRNGLDPAICARHFLKMALLP